MEKYVIRGGKKISGSVKIESAKNSVLPLIAASILTKEQVVIKNCPKIDDVINMLKIIEDLGVRWRFEQDDLIINAGAIESCVVDGQLAKKLRSSVLMLGALISRLKKSVISLPGGCDIGLRPVDLHLKALEEMGVAVDKNDGVITCSTKGVVGKSVRLDYPSVGATENAMLVAVTARGKTEIYNPAKEPEIIDLMRFLNSMGAKVYGAGTSTIFIEGVERLHGTEYLPISDRIETGTFLIAAAITGGEVEIKNAQVKNISSILHKLCDNTCKITLNNDIIYIKSGQRKKSFNFSTGPYPYFPTDLQAPAMALLAVSDGVSVVTENVFETRFKHVLELVKMGADISVKGKTAIINGVEGLHGANVCANDLRAGAALVLAGLNADGVTTVDGVCHVKRGYLNLDKKLSALGADVKIIN